MFKGIEFDKEEESEFRLHVLAENLKNIRDHFDLSQENLAEVTHVSVNEIGKIECEKVNRFYRLSVAGQGPRFGNRHFAYSRSGCFKT